MLQVYTGNGKGKTTAAIGLAIRSLGADKKVYFCQFMKTLAYSEQAILQKFAPQLKLTTSGKPYFIAKEGMLTDEEIKKWGDMLQVYPEGKLGVLTYATKSFIRVNWEFLPLKLSMSCRLV